MSARRQARAAQSLTAPGTSAERGRPVVGAQTVRGRLIRRHERRAEALRSAPCQAWHLAAADGQAPCGGVAVGSFVGVVRR